MTAAPAAAPLAGPWTRGARWAVLAGIAAGATVLGVAWIGVSGAGTFRDQTGWVEVAVGGSAVAATAQAGWLVHGRRRVGALRRSILPAIAAAGPAPGATGPARPVIGPISALTAGQGNGAGPAGAAPANAAVAVAGGRRYHRPGCLLVRGKPALPVDWPSSLQACEVCRP